MTATTTKANRQAFDRYITPAWMTQQLLKHHPISDEFSKLECCAGHGDIWKLLGGGFVLANDIDREQRWCDFNDDATDEESWSEWNQHIPGGIGFTITNPPYNVADLIVPLAYEYSSLGIAMLLRCTWLESTVTGSKAQWLADHPPSQIISLPRFSFSRSPSTGRWQTDSAPVWWMIWRKDGWKADKPFIVVPHTEIEGFHRKPIEDAAA